MKTQQQIKSLSRTKTQPIPVQRSARIHEVQALSSMPAGKMVPIAAIPLFREDSCRSGSFVSTVEMHETAEMLMNKVHFNLKAYLVPWLAFDRFDGMDDFNRSYAGEPRIEGGVVTPFIENVVAGPLIDNDIHAYLGEHVKEGALYNTMYVEAYNQVWNFRARNRSPDIQLRDRLATDLAPAFWQHEQFAHIVPDFDDATLDGEVPLTIVNNQIMVHGIGVHGDANALALSAGFRGPNGLSMGGQPGVQAFSQPAVAVRTKGTGTNVAADVFAELEADGITVSLSNIDVVRKTQAFAALRKQYEGHDDEWLINMLMDGLTVPEQQWKQPILLADATADFGQAKRYASDGASLTKSVVNGATQIEIRFQLPRVPVGGIIILVGEVTPQQLFERQKNPFLHATSVAEFPAYQRDYLDPQKVEIVRNDRIDIDHDTPNGIFGYEPLNSRYAHWGPRIGGRYLRELVDAPFDEDRQRIWAVETQNPTLSEDFYLCTTMHQKPFVEQDLDNFEIQTSGACLIEGNTVFGSLLIEGNNSSYDKTLAKAPMERIEP